MMGENSSRTHLVSTVTALSEATIARAVGDALSEDLGLAGDITTMATVREDARAGATLIVRERGVICGLDVARVAFQALDGSVEYTPLAKDGDFVEAGTEVAQVSGLARAVLSGERVALNFVGRMSGIATATRAYVDAIKGLRARIVDTRKTTPNLRAFEKYAVRCGGGYNHRAGLFDAMMIKDNHIVAARGLTPAIEKARAAAGHMVAIEVEVDTVAQLDELLDHADAVEAVLLDNMTPVELAKAVKLVSGRMICEASGGVTLSIVREIAETGVDVISVGALTHSAPTLDVGLDFQSSTGA